MTNAGDGDLADELAELERSVRHLQEELKSRSPRGPLGLPRPPSPGEVLQFTEESAIPALIAILEAHVRMLEAIQHGIRLARTGESSTRSAAQTVDAVNEETINQLDRLVETIQEVAGALPKNDQARAVLSEAEELRDTIEERVEEAKKSVEEQPSEDQIDSTEFGESQDRPETIDIDAELQSIKRQLNDHGEDDENEPEESESGSETGQNDQEEDS